MPLVCAIYRTVKSKPYIGRGLLSFIHRPMLLLHLIFKVCILALVQRSTGKIFH